MERYIGTKIIGAKPMNRREYNNLRGWELPADENGDDDGYLVEYLDSDNKNCEGFDHYISWSPAKEFEDAYRPATGLTFGMALEAMKRGRRVARTGWNGQGMFVYLVPPASYPVQTGAAKEYFGENSMVPYAAYMAIKNVDGIVYTWVPSVSDCLSDDWEIVGTV